MIHIFRGKRPYIHNSAFIAESADIIGEVVIHEEASIWYGAVLRGDGDKITVGKGTNIQDGCVIHINPGKNSVYIGENVTIGHRTVIHGAKIGNNSLIGMGSIVLDGADVGTNTLVGAGSLIPQGKKIPSGVLCMGSPVKVIRELTSEEIMQLEKSSHSYIELAKEYLNGIK